MKRAFSLIELMQTVILLGIIAGLSVSFFKKVNTNDKLWFSTQEKLEAAIIEANRQMCSDTTPTCRIPDGGQMLTEPYTTMNGDAECQAVYGNGNNVHYDSHRGLCVSNFVNPCPAPIVANIGGISVDSMVASGNAFCWATPPCNVRNCVPVDPAVAGPGYDCSGEPQDQTYKAISLSRYLCHNNIPNYRETIDVNNGGGLRRYPALCYYLHSILMHKPQGTNAGDDLDRTCLSAFNPNPFTNNDPISADNVTNMVNLANGGGAINDNYAMLLPNGVYLYNLSNGFTAAGQSANIYIKYDRVQNSRSARYAVGADGNMDPKNSTIGAITVVNPADPPPAAP